jgi:hypothetical protein
MTIASSRPVHAIAVAAVSAILLSWTTLSQAQPTITPANAGRGFVISSFIDLLPVNSPTSPIQNGPTGIGFLQNNSVIFMDWWGGNPIVTDLFSVPDHSDNQPGAYPVSNYGLEQFVGLAQIEIGGAWHYYSNAGGLVEINPANGLVVETIIPGLGAGTAMVPFPPAVPGPLSGHLFDYGTENPSLITAIWDIDPVAKTKSLFGPLTLDNVGISGLAFSTDGSTLYAVGIDTVRAFDVPSEVQLWTIGGLLDYYLSGVAVGVGNLDGYIYVSGWPGSIWEVGIPGGPHAGAINQLTTANKAGIVLAADPDVMSGGSYPSLLLTQLDRIYRIDPPGGGWFGPPTSSLLPVGQSNTAVPPAPGPSASRLLSIAPNPTLGPARVDFALEREGRAHLGVLDVQGREVAAVADGSYPAGTQHAVWDGRTTTGEAPAGVYFIQLRTEGRVFTQRIARLR